MRIFFMYILILLLLVFITGASSEYNNPLTIAIANSLYCKLTGCSMRGNINFNNQTNNAFDTCTLSSGTCTINNNKVTASTGIFCMSDSGSVNLGSLSITSRTTGTSYVVTSSNALQSTTVDCILIEPVPQ